jgi:hypothetical protein
MLSLQCKRQSEGGKRTMNRIFALALSSVLFLAGTTAWGQEWAKKMFKATKHDFGTVARGSKQEFAFKFTNIYKEDIHIVGVESSCGCTSAKVTKNTLKTYEEASILATYNTRSFLGAKSATLTVTIDEPYYAEVQLTVGGYIRSDVVFEPGAVDFGSVDAGLGAKKVISVAYAGRDDWEITDVRSGNRHYEVELEETYRGGGRVNYNMVVRLKSDAPVGYVRDPLLIVSNDGSSKDVSLPVEGQVVSTMTVSPASLFLGVLKPGESVKKRLVVRGKKPFKIVDVKCEDAHFTFEKPSEEAKSLHFLPIEYKAGEEAGNIVKKIEIETDLGEGVCAECMASATIQP